MIFTTPPIKGKKVVATRVRIEKRVQRDWRGRGVSMERRLVTYSLHPTKGWRRTSTTVWARVY